MKKKHDFKLIDGTFTAPEARRVLFDLISSKISYHSMEKVSNQERFGKDASHSEKRIKSLRKLQTSLKKVFDFAEKQGMNLKIDGLIELKIVE
ncbi:hypothetical protein BH11BAC4_BH11BAC4_08660 [soil metagenome]